MILFHLLSSHSTSLFIFFSKSSLCVLCFLSTHSRLSPTSTLKGMIFISCLFPSITALLLCLPGPVYGSASLVFRFPFPYSFLPELLAWVGVFLGFPPPPLFPDLTWWRSSSSEHGSQSSRARRGWGSNGGHPWRSKPTSKAYKKHVQSFRS